MTDAVKVHVDGEVEIDFDPYYMELEKPIKFGKDCIESFKLKELTCKDMRAINANGNMQG
ncbi:MAG: phage tail assembly protein [Oligoflexales bacterium]